MRRSAACARPAGARTNASSSESVPEAIDRGDVTILMRRLLLASAPREMVDCLCGRSDRDPRTKTVTSSPPTVQARGETISTAGRVPAAVVRDRPQCARPQADIVQLAGAGRRLDGVPALLRVGCRRVVVVSPSRWRLTGVSG